MPCIGLIIALLIMHDDMKRSETEKELKNIAQAKSNEINSETDKEILEKIQKREDESEALRKLLVNLKEPTSKKSKHHK